ncbi:MAG: hypothetical protein N2C12_16105 [Planctomycetales bacterium]
MSFDESEQERNFHEAWSTVQIVRSVSYSLFTFGESVLPYYLVCGNQRGTVPLSITQGDIRIKRPMIVTPDNRRPEFQNFFENEEEEGVIQFLLARTARFSNLQFVNESASKQVVTDSMDAAVDKISKQLDDEEDDRVAILTAPSKLAGIAVLKYTADRVFQSAPDNIQELRERGFLP